MTFRDRVRRRVLAAIAGIRRHLEALIVAGGVLLLAASAWAPADVVEAIVVGILAIEIAVAAVVAWLNFREVRFLEEVRPLLPPDEELPLFDALFGRARYVTVCAVYLLLLTFLGAIGITVANMFPILRAINGALLLGLLAGPLVLGAALRRKRERAES